MHRLVLGGGAGGFSRHKYFPKSLQNDIRQPDEQNKFHLIRLSVNQDFWVGLKKVGTGVLVHWTDLTYILYSPSGCRLWINL